MINWINGNENREILFEGALNGLQEENILCLSTGLG